MTDDFFLVDFAVLKLPPEIVVPALGRLKDGAGGPSAQSAHHNRGMLSRLRRLWSATPGAGARHGTLAIQPVGSLPPAPLARLMPDDLGFGAGDSPFRITSPVGTANLTLIEFREGDTGTATICEALSAICKGTAVFYFRLSGLHHPGSETVFHVYLDGRAVRRTASLSVQGTTPEADWRVVDTGMPHTVEADSLPPAQARAWDVMTPERQGLILAAMGIDPNRLFAPERNATVLELSTAPGGRPLHDIPTRTRQTPAPKPRDATEAPTPAPQAPPTVPPHIGKSPNATDEADDGWDSEVTDILVTAVAHALPEEEHIPWLTHLTEQLESGNIEAALEEATALIEIGNRPADERQRDAARLAAFFGVSTAPKGP